MSKRKQALRQFAQDNRYVIYAGFGEKWDFECLLGYFPANENPSGPFSVGVHLGGNPNTAHGKKATSAFRDLSKKSNGSWKGKALHGTDGKDTWYWIEQTVELQAFLAQEDPVKAIKNHFLSLLQEMNQFKDAHTELPWAQQGNRREEDESE